MYLVSACLAGEACRMDGGSNLVPAIRAMVERGEAIPVCPEVLGGLPTPRPPSERLPDGRVVNCEGVDVTAAFRLGAERVLAVCLEAGCSCAVLKARSPSCGCGVIYDGSFTHTRVPGNGVCAELLMNYGIHVMTEDAFMEQNRIRDRIRGSLIAGAAGDALGYAVEFTSEPGIFKHFGPGGIRAYVCDPDAGKALVSDDTQMTLFTAAGILAARDGLGRVSVAEAYRDWYKTQHLDWLDAEEQLAQGRLRDSCGLLAVPELYAQRAPGNTCLSALRASFREGDPGDLDFIAHPRNHSKGCGGVMRAAPAAWIPGLSADQAVSEAAQFAAVTHGHPHGWLSAAALAYLVREMTLTERPLREIALETRDVLRRLFPEFPETAEFCGLLDKTLALAENALPDLDNIHALGEGWVGEEALAIALYCALRHEDDLSSCLIAAVNHKGDSDSTGAVAGNILGARIGYESMEEKWKTDLELHDRILNLADRLTDAYLAAI